MSLEPAAEPFRLYTATGSDVSVYRPLFTDVIFSHVEIPGVALEADQKRATCSGASRSRCRIEGRGRCSGVGIRRAGEPRGSSSSLKLSDYIAV